MRLAPRSLFRPRFSRRPATVALVALLLLAPVLLVPNPQDAVIAQQQQVREAAERQAEASTASPRTSRPRAQTRTIRARDLRRSCAISPASSATSPDDLDVNLARLGAIESDVRAQIDPANEQRAASLTSLSRALSSAATGKPDANREGDPEKARDDLKDLAEGLDDLTPEQQKDLARQLAEMEATASQADGAAGTALSEAAQSLAQGDTAGAVRRSIASGRH